MTANSSTLADLEAARRSNGEFGTQDHAESGIVPTPTPGTFYVYIERQDLPDECVGPFPTEEAAGKAVNEAKIVDDLCMEDCLECYVIEAADLPEGMEGVCYLDDPDTLKSMFDPEPEGPNAVLADRVITSMIEDSYRLNDFRGYTGDYFRGYTGDYFRDEVAQVAGEIQSLDIDPDTTLVFIPDEDNSDDLIGFTMNGVTVTEPADFSELSTDHTARKVYQARAIADALLAKRDSMVAEFRAKLSAGQMG